MEKEKSNKWKDTLLKGSSRREVAVSILNSGFAQEGVGLSFRSLQKQTNWRPPSKKHMQVENFKIPKPSEKAMALYQILTNAENNESIPFIFLFRNGFDFFIKIPHNANPSFYLENLAKENYHVLVVEDKQEEIQFSNPIHMDIVRNWSHHLSKAKQNSNRLIFEVPLKKISCRPIHIRTLISGTVLDELNILFQ